MNIYLKSFFHRGLLFGGFGPIIVGIVYLMLEKSVPGFSLSGTQVCLAIASSYLLAFVQAGASIFNQIEHWSLPKSLLYHFGSLYLTYVLCYILNSWIPFKYEIILIFTGIFVAAYFVIWTIVYFSVNTASRRMNRKLN